MRGTVLRTTRIAEALAAKLGKEKVLYDKWYRAEGVKLTV